MATKAKAGAPPDDEDETSDTEDQDGEAKAESKKAGLAGRLLAPVFAIMRYAAFLNPLTFLKLPLKQKLMAGGGLVTVIAAAGAGVMFLMPSGEEPSEAALEEMQMQTAAVRLPAAQAVFFNVPDIIVNIQSPDSTPAYLKLAVALELDRADVATTIEPVMPRIVDQFQTYLRELRVEDIRGSAGVMRLKEELLRRVNLAAAPTPVRDVLLKEMIVQ